MGERTYHDPSVGDVTLKKSDRCRRISLRVHPTRGICVTMPRIVPYEAGLAFYMSRREWVIATVAKQKAIAEATPALSPEQTAQVRKAAAMAIPKKTAMLAERYGFRYGRLALKNNRTNWGSCSSMNNINLNINLVRIPEVLCDYVILHELCHLRHHNHGPEFHALLERLCADNLSRLASKYSVIPEGLSPEREDGWREEASYIAELKRQILRSRSTEPHRFVMEQKLKKYRLG